MREYTGRLALSQIERRNAVHKEFRGIETVDIEGLIQLPAQNPPSDPVPGLPPEERRCSKAGQNPIGGDSNDPDLDPRLDEARRRQFSTSLVFGVDFQ